MTRHLATARWAPSAQNSQPWRFLVSRRGDASHDRLFGVLAPGNQTWAGAASALILVAARTVGADGRPQQWALYDTGLAVGALMTQAQADGLSVHQMGGFDTEADLPEPLAAREAAPRTRQPVSELLLPVPAAEPAEAVAA